MALKQRAEQSAHTETLGWEEEEEGMLGSLIYSFTLKRVHVTLLPTFVAR